MQNSETGFVSPSDHVCSEIRSYLKRCHGATEFQLGLIRVGFYAHVDRREWLMAVDVGGTK